MIHVASRMPQVKGDLTSVYTIHPAGYVDIDHRLTPKQPMIRFGMQGVLMPGLRELHWYGHGPHENYIDRQTGAPLGRYSGDVETLIHDYMHPQENGNRGGVRWAEVRDAQGRGIRFEALDAPLETSLHPYTMAELEAAEHIHELPHHEQVTLNIDFRQRGVGVDLSGMGGLSPQYTIPAGEEYRFRFRITGLQ